MKKTVFAAALAALATATPSVASDSLSSFDAFHVPPVEVALDLDVRAFDRSGAGDRPVDDDDAVERADKLRSRIIDALDDVGAIVDAPGPGVLTVAVTLTDLRSTRPTSADIKREPGLSFDSVYAGGAAFEAVFSSDGEALGDLDGSWYGSFADRQPRVGIWQDADTAFRVFSRRIVDSIEAD